MSPALAPGAKEVKLWPQVTSRTSVGWQSLDGDQRFDQRPEPLSPELAFGK